MGITALFNNCHPDILPNMKLFKILFLVSNVATAPGNYFSLRSNPTAPKSYFTRTGFPASPQTYFTRKHFAASPQTYFTRKSFAAAPQTYFTRTRFPPAPQTYSSRIDIDSNVYKVEKENYVTDNRVKVDVSSKSPSTAAALAYVNSVVKEGLCGKAAEAYVKSILDGKSKEAASGEATRAYITAFNSGERYEKGGACEAAERAWRDASANRQKDHVLEATLAFIKKWPGVEDGNPCAVAGTDYVKEILAGKSHTGATSAAMRGFIKAFKEKANNGAPLNDEACHKASRAFFEAVPYKSDPIIGAGFAAFSDKLFAGNGVVYDPVCLDAMETFIDSHSAGEDLLTSNLKAARSFFKAFVSNPQTIPADSPCASATLSYAQALNKGPSSAANAGMIAYINEAIKQKDRVFDPVCGAATLAYWDTFIDKKNEAAASEAAAVAYLDALEANPDFDENGACGRAAKAYIEEFQS